MNLENIMRKIFLKRTGIDFSVKKELRTDLLFGEHIGMPARELIYVYFDIERAIGMEIPESYIIQNQFDTYEHILECVRELYQSAKKTH